MNEAAGVVMIVCISFLVSFVVLLVCREIVCWYFKMNETTQLLKEIRDSLKRNVPMKP